MDTAQAQAIADSWMRAYAQRWKATQLAAHYQVNRATLFAWRRKAEAVLGKPLPTLVGAPNIAKFESRRATMAADLPPLPGLPTLTATTLAALPPLPTAREFIPPEPEPVVQPSYPKSQPDLVQDQYPARRDRRQHYVVPDLQLTRSSPTDHLEWIGRDIARRRPHVVVLLGDVWDMPSLSMHDAAGSMAKEGSRYEDDIAAGNNGMAKLMAPILAEPDYKPRLVFLEGNHEYRIIRTIEADPRYAGVIGMHHCNVEKYGFERHKFLTVIQIDGIHYSHYFQMAGSDRPIGGSMDNRLNKICATFVQGHEQGLLQHRRPLPIGRTIHGIVAGSAYMHSEDYRGPQRNNEWRGTVVLHDVRDGDCDPMPLTLQYLASEYGGVELHDLMTQKYPSLPRGWAR